MKGLLILMTHGLFISAFSQSMLRLSVDDCISYGLGNNEQLAITDYDKQIANLEVRETIAEGLPQATINGGLNYNYEIQKSLLDVSNFSDAPPGTEEEVAFGQDYDGNLVLEVNQLIFDGSYFVGLQAARTYRDLSSKDHIETQIDVVEAVSKAYYFALISVERLELVKANLARIDTLLSETIKMYEAGFAEKLEVDRIKVTYNNLKVDLSESTQLKELSEKLLKFQMGMDLNQNIELTENLDEVDVSMPLIPSSNFNYADRIEFSQLITGEQLKELDMKNNRSQYLPTLNANFSYGYNTATSDFDQLFTTSRWLNYGVIGLSASIPVFDGFMKRSRIQQNKLELKQLESEKSFLRKSIDIEIEESRITLTSQIETLEVQKQNVELARYIYDIAKVKYQQGVGSNLEVTDADTAFKEAQINYLDSVYEAKTSQIELKKALGILYTN
ncbi:MAG: TolC family protein [Bacteroidota bacterium]